MSAPELYVSLATHSLLQSKQISYICHVWPNLQIRDSYWTSCSCKTIKSKTFNSPWFVPRLFDFGQQRTTVPLTQKEHYHCWSPKWFSRHLVHAFSIFGRVSSQFVKIMFLDAFWRRFTLSKGQKLVTGGQARKMPQKSFFFLHKWHSQILGSFELSLLYGQNRPYVAHFLAQK